MASSPLNQLHLAKILHQLMIQGMTVAGVFNADDLVARIQDRLTSGATLQQRHRRRRAFSPSLSYGRHFAPPLPSARRAAVMVLLEPREQGWTIPLTVRPTHLPDHPGQICLPGGRVELGETHQEAAEREFCEELGLSKFPGETLGSLQSIYVYNSNFYLTPFVAISRERLVYSPCQEEVQTLIHLPIRQLADKSHHRTEVRSRGHVSWNSPGISVDGHFVWGATAIVLGEVAELF